TRVVVDLNAAHQSELVSGRDGHFTLKIQDGTVARRVSAPAAQPLAVSSAPKLVQASAKEMTTVNAPVPTVASAQPAAKPVDFAFVEPSYAAKNDNVAPPVEPAVKAQGAAEPFADKTATEHVATNASHAPIKH